MKGHLMPKSFSLYPPVLSFAAMVAGIGCYSIPAALIVGGGLVTAGWVAYFAMHVRAEKR
jgi:hypothetical protein